jgi:hypothetical protein
MKKYIDPKSKENYLAESIVSQVGVGAGNPNVDAGSANETPFKGKLRLIFLNSNSVEALKLKKFLKRFVQK